MESPALSFRIFFTEITSFRLFFNWNKFLEHLIFKVFLPASDIFSDFKVAQKMSNNSEPLVRNVLRKSC